MIDPKRPGVRDLAEHKARAADRESYLAGGLPTASGGSALAWGKVVLLKRHDGATWTDYPTHLVWPTFCTVNPCAFDGTGVDATTIKRIVLNASAISGGALRADPASYKAGSGLITAVNQIIGYTTGAAGAMVQDPGLVPADGHAELGLGCWIDYIRTL